MRGEVEGGGKEVGTKEKGSRKFCKEKEKRINSHERVFVTELPDLCPAPAIYRNRSNSMERRCYLKTNTDSTSVVCGEFLANCFLIAFFIIFLIFLTNIRWRCKL